MLPSSRRLPTWTPLWLAALLLVSAPVHAATTAGGQGHSAAVLPDGTVWVWGAADRGQLGDGTGVPSLTPAQVPGLAGIVAVASGHAHLLALTGTGDVWAWGANESGQVGDGTNGDRLVPVPVLSGVAGIAAVVGEGSVAEGATEGAAATVAGAERAGVGAAVGGVVGEGDGVEDRPRRK